MGRSAAIRAVILPCGTMGRQADKKLSCKRLPQRRQCIRRHQRHQQPDRCGMADKFRALKPVNRRQLGKGKHDPR